MEIEKTSDQTPNSEINESRILLELARDITKVRVKDDLILLFSKKVKSLFYFTHTIVTLIDKKDETYWPFLLNTVDSPIRNHPYYEQLVKGHDTLKEPFIKSVIASDGPALFVMEDVMDLPDSPRFLKVNYEGGTRALLMTTLWDADGPIGFLHIYTDKPESFRPEFKSILKNIAPQLSGAVLNIIKNEQIIEKENEKAFLLDFSNDITGVRNKEDLSIAVRTALNKISPLKGYVIRSINSDGTTMSTYLYDESIIKNDNSIQSIDGKEKYPIKDGLQNRIFESYIPLLFSIDREIERNPSIPYLNLWKQVGFTMMAGIALRNANTDLGILWLGIDEINISLLKGICAQISMAIGNIMANEDLETRNREQSVLLQFSNEIAGVRKKADLEIAIINVLRDVLDTKLAMINSFDDDGIGLTPYMNDRSLFIKAMERHDERVANKLDIYEPYTAKVVNSNVPVVFNVENELKNNNSLFAQLWKQVGFENAYGALLRVGDHNVGTLWLLADNLNSNVLKGICSQISVAMANMQANEKLQQYKQQLEHENVYLKEQIKTIYNFSEIIGDGPQMQKVYQLMTMVAESNSTVLILGETGTGKELIARAIHNASPRKDNLMIKVNCAAMPANLIESELFGHEKGAFTGAYERRIGKFELANNSTLFLDEIGEMPLEAQVKLLRVLQERELERVGGKETIKVNVRIVAATNRDLEQEIAAGRFRADLYYRLNVFPISLPPLRERMEDLEPLANFFLLKHNRNTGKNISRIASKAMQQLQSYLWPGNIRELEHLMERSILMATDQVLHEVYLPKRNDSNSSAEQQPADQTLDMMERNFILMRLKDVKAKFLEAVELQKY